MLKWFPWKWILRKIARAQGFADPMRVVAELQKFSQPSEVAAPIELLRLSSVLHVRGLINAQAIQHNLDWIWPHWVQRQFDPRDAAFVPRAFSMTHINLTHRDWTGLGLPETREIPIVDPRGALTPHYDGWSLDCWIYESPSWALTPAKLLSVRQKLTFGKGLSVETESEKDGTRLKAEAWVEDRRGVPHVCLKVCGESARRARLVLALRPMNPEGVSFIHSIEWNEAKKEWTVNKKQKIYAAENPDAVFFSHYREGDVFLKLDQEPPVKKAVQCSIGMATSALVYRMSPGRSKEALLAVPLKEEGTVKSAVRSTAPPGAVWQNRLRGLCELDCPDPKFQFLYDAAIRTLVLHAPGATVYPGPYTYKHFWFRDAAFILEAMITAGFIDKAEQIIDTFPSKQTPFGHFCSQDGEWDSNGEALWVFERFVSVTGRVPKPAWLKSVEKGAKWLIDKRLPETGAKTHDGLLPAGFSAEHLGPNDYYYWDDFWGVQGLRSAAALLGGAGKREKAAMFEQEAKAFMRCIEESLKKAEARLGTRAMPAAPSRRLDTGAIGSIAAGYPLQLWAARDPRLLETLEYLLENCMVEDGFFHDMSHSGINAYLTLQMAQVLLRAGDPRYSRLMNSIAGFASATGQWPEAIHPRTRGGCMGDGQHVWAAAEWVLMIRNCFVREEKDHLVLCAGLPAEWLQKAQPIRFGPAGTRFGEITVRIEFENAAPKVRWQGRWHAGEPEIKVQLPVSV